MDTTIINKVKTLKAEASKHFSFEKCYIYGSYSKDNFTNHSDIDVAFLTNGINNDFWTHSAKLFEIVFGIDSRLEPIILNYNDSSNELVENIKKNGIEV